jgi:hypothetical protein
MLQSFEALRLRLKRVTRYLLLAPAKSAANGFWQMVLVVLGDIRERQKAPMKVGAFLFLRAACAARLSLLA